MICDPHVVPQKFQKKKYIENLEKYRKTIFFNVLQVILMCFLVEPKGMNCPEQNFRCCCRVKCSWLKREGLEGKDNDFLGILKSITSSNCPCLFFEGFINHSILSILSVPAVMEVDGGGSGQAGTGGPCYPAPCVSLGSEVCCPLPAQASELVLRTTVFRLPFPICSGVFTFLIPVLNNFYFSCPVHILHPALQVSDLWILL